MRRHLAYHLYPLRGSDNWRWNISKLKQYLNQFDGLRLMSIMTGPDCDSPRDVQQELCGTGIECLFLPNSNYLRETVSFVPLISRLEHQSGITFWGHAKGTLHPAVHPTIRGWASAMYQACLSSPPLVDVVLRNFPIAGPFKRHGEFWQTQNAGWHYSGTFFWFNNHDVFCRDWSHIFPGGHGVEGWPGTLFRNEEAACLICDHAGDLYNSDYWDNTVQPLVTSWSPTATANRFRTS